MKRFLIAVLWTFFALIVIALVLPDRPTSKSSTDKSANKTEQATASSGSEENVPVTDSVLDDVVPRDVLVGLGKDPAKLPPNQRDKWKKMRDAVLVDAHILRGAALNPDSVRFYGAWGMEDGWECFGFVAQNGFGGLTDVKAVISPLGKVYTYQEVADEQTPGFFGAWNKHCARKVPFVDATHMGP